MGIVWTEDVLRDTSALQTLAYLLQAALQTFVTVTSTSYSSVASDQRILVKQGAPATVTITMLLSANYKAPILIKDENGTASASTPINVVFSGGETMDGLTTVPIRDPYGHVTLMPQPGGGGFYEG